jgi:hypothetical protein
MGKFGIVAVLLAAIFNAAPALADISDSQLEGLIGWTIIGTKKISGYVKEDGAEVSGFAGCDHGRVIIFSDRTTVTCQSYGYHYSFVPTAVLLGKTVSHEGQSFTLLKMIVNDNIYDVSAH